MTTQAEAFDPIKFKQTTPPVIWQSHYRDAARDATWMLERDARIAESEVVEHNLQIEQMFSCPIYPFPGTV